MLYFFNVINLPFKLNRSFHEDQLMYIPDNLSIGSYSYGIVVKPTIETKGDYRFDKITHLKYRDRALFVNGYWEPL